MTRLANKIPLRVNGQFAKVRIAGRLPAILSMTRLANKIPLRLSLSKSYAHFWCMEGKEGRAYPAG